MNQLTIIGNLTRDPETRDVSGVSCCTFTVAVNRPRKQGEEEQADFFRVTAWRQLGETCSRFLAKGRKVAASGPVTARTYQANDGSTRVSLEVTAEDVEFLSTRDDQEQSYQRQEREAIQQEHGFTPVEASDLPF